MGLKLSIHGRDISSGKQHNEPYNKNPREQKAPSTERGRRRLANKGQPKAGKDKK